MKPLTAILLIVLLALGLGYLYGLKQAPKSVPAKTPSQDVARLQVENRRLEGEVRRLRTQLTEPVAGTRPARPQAAQTLDPEQKAKSRRFQIGMNLGGVVHARGAFALEHGRDPVSLQELTDGPDAFLPPLKSIAGEDYSALVTAQTVSVTTPDGETHGWDPNSIVWVDLNRLRNRLRMDPRPVSVAYQRCVRARGNTWPKSPEEVVQYFNDPEDAKTYVAAVKALRARVAQPADSQP